MVHCQSFEVILIDFGFACKLGDNFIAGGTPDFMDDQVLLKIERRQMIKISAKKDFYPFSLICVILLESYPPFRFNNSGS